MYPPPDVIIINAHGNQNGFMLSNENNSGRFSKTTLDKTKLKPFLDWMKNLGIEIVLNSCSTGMGENIFHGKAAEMSLKVISAKDSIRSGTNIELVYDNESRKVLTKSIGFVDADTNYYKGHHLGDKE
jgi:hypothetical protein